jgi:hypothetical protein
MTVNEMHIAVNLGVQKLASFQADNLLPEEIDHELNLSVMRFIKQRYNPSSNRQGKGFEQSQKRIDDLKHLVSTQTGTTASFGYAGDTLGGYIYTANNSNIYVDRYTLPLDYLFLVNITAQVYYECNASIFPKYTPNFVNLYTAELDLTPPLPGYFLSMIERWDTASNNWTQITNVPLGEELTRDLLINQTTYFNIPSLKATINDLRVGALNDTAQGNSVIDSNTLYLERYNAPFETDPNTGYYLRLTWLDDTGPSNAIYVSINKYIYFQTSTERRAPTASNRLSYCKFAQHDDIIAMMDDPFNITDYRSPIYTIRENYIDIHTDNTFVVPNVFINYIRKPKNISLSTGVGCELPIHTHDEIIEMTVKSILEGFESQRYQSQSMETFESE